MFNFLNNLLGSTTRTIKTRKSTTRKNKGKRLGLEALECRNLMAVSVFYEPITSATGSLRVVGTEAADNIQIYQPEFHLNVVTNRPSDAIRVLGAAGEWEASQIQRIDVEGLGGDDVVGLDGSGLVGIVHGAQAIKTPTRIYAGPGNNRINGGSGNDEIHGHDNKDTIYSGHGHDVIFGYGGDDTIVAGDGNDTIYAGSGNDTVGSAGIQGDHGDDVIYGGDGNDWVNAGVGADKVFGEGGNDVLDGWSGNDEVWGGFGADQIYGGEGNDLLVGEAGNDGIWGGPNDDRIFGQAGIDHLVGDAGNDNLFGGTENDRLFGMAGNDVLSGEEGHDKLKGGSERDLVLGGNGADWLMEGQDDLLVGGRINGDTDEKELRTLLNVWQISTLSFSERHNFLVNGFTYGDGVTHKLAGTDDGATDYMNGVANQTLLYYVATGATKDTIDYMQSVARKAAQPTVTAATLTGNWQVFDLSEQLIDKAAGFSYTLTISNVRQVASSATGGEWQFTFQVGNTVGTGRFFPGDKTATMSFQPNPQDKRVGQVSVQLYMNDLGQWVMSGTTKILGNAPEFTAHWQAAKL